MPQEARQISPRLADWLSAIAEEDFDFTGSDPLNHSSHNHEHLWLLEWSADDFKAIDLAFRERAVSWIFDQWRSRLRGYRPYRELGFRLYLYEDTAPSVSVVAETPLGFPYGGEPTFVRSLTDVLRPYVARNWRGMFASFATERQTPIRILDAVEAAQGSIGRAGAQRAGANQAQLRRLIENWGISRDVNRIRKKYRRSPARFREESEIPFRYKIFEERLPPGY